MEVAAGALGIIVDIRTKWRAFREERDQLVADDGGLCLELLRSVELIAFKELALCEIGIIKDRRLLRIDRPLALQHL